MTEQEMIKRIQEIDIERNQLRAEKEKYEDYLRDKRRQEKIEYHKTFIGKCFIIQNNVESEDKHTQIQAFKVICIENDSDEHYAKCIALIKGNKSCFTEYGVCIITLPLWSDKHTIRRKSNSKIINNSYEEMCKEMIDFYDEITQDKFDNLCKEYLGNLESNVYKQVGNVNNEGSNQ